MNIKTGLPITFFSWLLLSIALLIISFFSGVSLFYACFVAIVISVILYIIVAQFSCSFILNENSITFNYLLSKPKVVSLLQIQRAEFELSYFFFFEEDFKMGIFYWFRPYDTMYLFYDKGEEPIAIKFNSSFKGTLKMYRYLKKKYHIPYWEKNSNK